MKSSPVVIGVCILWLVFGSAPIVFSCPPFPATHFFQGHPLCHMLGRDLLAGLLALAVRLIWQWDAGGKRGKLVRYFGFALLAGLLTDLHYFMVDMDPDKFQWQTDQWVGIFQHTYLPPDQYRFLSQGTLWWMTLTNSDFDFSYYAFRFFFTLLLCLAIYRLARLYLPTQASVLIVFLYGAFYSLSIRFYCGNLCDPMSHLIMLTALYYCRLRQFWSFFWLFILGVFTKETMLLLAPCYYLMNLEHTRLRQEQNWQRMILLGLAGFAAFFACRLPFHFAFSYQCLNRTTAPMIWSNLGIGHPPVDSFVPVFLRYLHPILFIFMWLPLILIHRRRLPDSLFWTSLYLAAGLYATNTWCGWNYESRNFVPGLILLLICTMVILREWVHEDPAEAPEEGAYHPPLKGQA
jgi:hypothetical protein